MPRIAATKARGCGWQLPPWHSRRLRTPRRACKAPKTYAHPVLEFLARSQSQQPTPGFWRSRYAQRGSRPQANAISEQRCVSGLLLAMLPVFFIGLIAPLALVSAASLRCSAARPRCLCFPRSSSARRPAWPDPRAGSDCRRRFSWSTLTSQSLQNHGIYTGRWRLRVFR